jgi:tRNA C32,U32 (ribose-2'-O)-methylase TrmJ
MTDYYTTVLETQESRQRRKYLSKILQQLLSRLNMREKDVRALTESVQRIRQACGEDKVQCVLLVCVGMWVCMSVSVCP